jgi:hypothetical protein
MRSGIIAILTGALRNIAAEFDRRIAVGHENRQTEPSGDGDMLREYALEISGDCCQELDFDEDSLDLSMLKISTIFNRAMITL